MIITPKKIEILPVSIELPEEQSIIIPKLILTEVVNIHEESESSITNELPRLINEVQSMLNILEHCDPITSLDKLKEKLTKLGIRFNTDPKLYQKADYWLLICILYRALVYLYGSNPESVIVTKWLTEHSDEKVPSEKLVKETIDSELLRLEELISLEQSDRQLADLNLLSSKQDIISDLNDIRNGASLGATALQSFTETDPTVPSWAKQSNKPSYTASEIGALPDNTFIPTNVSDLNNDAGYITSKDIQVIDKTSDTSSSFAIDANKMYMFGTRTNLTVTLNTGTSGIVNEYMFQFTSGSTATTLNVPNTVVWLKDPDILTDKKYSVSIENNLGIIGEWDNE